MSRARSPAVMPDVLVDGVPASTRLLHDRGLAYGDGLFETMRVVAGRVPLWPWHLRRLQHGLRRLGIEMPSKDALQGDVSSLARGQDAIVKLIVARHGGRGYAPHGAAGMSRLALRYAPPDDAAIDHARGVRVRWCRLRLGLQPALAGLKHLNRLEQVLARAEWRDERVHEGLLRDSDGHVICATASNVFIVRDGVVQTPRIDRCGVAGVARAWTLAQVRRWRLPVRESRLSPVDIESADEVFLTNAVRGIVPVRAVGSATFDVGPVAQRLGYTLAALGIGRHPRSNA